MIDLISMAQLRVDKLVIRFKVILNNFQSRQFFLKLVEKKLQHFNNISDFFLDYKSGCN